MAEFAGTERYRVERLVGAGGMGSVYRAFDTERDERVALKLLQKIDADALGRFKEEFRSLTDILHPNLVQLYELSAADGQWFFTMELLEGEGFVHHVQGELRKTQTSSSASPVDIEPPTQVTDAEGSVPGVLVASPIITQETLRTIPPALAPALFERLRSAGRQIVRGVDALHAAGKLHCDLKPSNVLVTHEGRAVVLDFGLVADVAASRVRRHVVAGTPEYMSPEQCQGLPLDPAADWYAVGVMLFEALAGRLPFRGRSANVMREKVRYEPPRIDEFRDGVPAELVELVGQMLRRKPAERPGPQEILQRLGGGLDGTTRVVAASPRVPSTLIGRSAELQTLRTALKRSRDGPAGVFVHGPSGMGKSALVRHFLRGLRGHGPVILEARCYEREFVPYKALDNLVDALTKFVNSLPVSDRETVLPDDAGYLAMVFPVLAKLANPLALADTELPPDEIRRRAASALKRILRRVGERGPLVLYIDDLQWGDVDSAPFLAEIVRAPDAPKMLIIFSYRSEEASGSELIQRLLSDDGAESFLEGVEHVRVGPLGREETRRIALSLMRRSDAESVARANKIADESQGSPIFVEILATDSASLREDAPFADLDNVLERRVAALPEGARAMLRAICLSGRPTPQKVIREATELDHGEQAALTMLRLDRLVRTSGPRLEDVVEAFHDRIREAVVVGIDSDQVATLHASLANALENHGGAPPDALAVHFLGAGDMTRGRRYALIAAETAERALAFDQAAQFYKRVLDTGAKTTELLGKFASTLAAAGRAPEAGEAYLAAAKASESFDRLALTRQAAEQFLTSGYVDQGKRALARVLRAVGLRLPRSRNAAMVKALWCHLQLGLRGGLRFRERPVSSIDPMVLARIDACWAVARGLTMADIHNVFHFHARGLLLALRCGEPYRIARALTLEIIHSSIRGTRSIARTQRLLTALEGLVSRLDRPDITGNACFAKGISAYSLGRRLEARDLFTRAEAMFRAETGEMVWGADSGTVWGEACSWGLGDIRRLTTNMRGLLSDAQRRGDRVTICFLHTWLFNTYWLIADDVGGAQRAIELAEEARVPGGVQVLDTLQLYARGQLELYRGRPAEAVEVLQRQLPKLRRAFLLTGQVERIELYHLEARAWLALASCASDGAALRGARRALARVRAEQVSWGQALGDLAQAALLDQSGDREAATTMLKSAERRLSEANMKLYAAAAKRRLGALTGGVEGQRAVEEVDAWMRGQTIRNPAQMCEMLAPGFSR